MPFIGTTPRQGFTSHIASQNLSANVNGSTTVFTLTNPVATANDLEVFVGNVRQEPTAAYSAAGTTLTFTEAPPNGFNVYVNYKGQAQITSTPPDNSISTAKILNDAVTGTKLADDIAISTTGNITGAEVNNSNFMIDQWRLTSNYATNDSVIVANWERVDDASFGRIGTGMTESSGIFTFPSTGVYFITVHARIQIEASDVTAGIELKISTDGGGSSDVVATAYESNTGSSNTNSSASASILVNVTNTSNFQFFLKTASIEGTNSEIRGNTSESQTMITFERKGPAQ